ncbi:helix-turn-helix domain-containing protein [Paracoccus sp. NSM]|uniref:helix-turn-helix domain-containing protein n=1 Tax=Paracoccus sp. NSM TaxID=3457784 RepID=UPI0040357553
MTDRFDPEDAMRRAWQRSIPAHLRAKPEKPDRAPPTPRQSTARVRAAAARRAELAPRVAELRAQGATMPAVAEALGIGLGTVHKIIRENRIEAPK